MNMVINVLVPQTAENVLTNLVIISFRRKTLFRGVILKIHDVSGVGLFQLLCRYILKRSILCSLKYY